MKAKLSKHILVKADEGKYFLFKEDETGFRIQVCKKLSLKNCEAIANGYDLDELAEEEFPYDFDIPLFETLGITEKVQKSILIGVLQGTLLKGFQKALQILDNKKFSDGDMLKAFITGVFTEETSDHYFEFTELMKDLQQTEWYVKIENKYDFPEVVHELDAENCLILKRK